MPIKQQAIFQMEIKMITGFNKKELRLFEKYRKQWNKRNLINKEKFNFGIFIHTIEEYSYLFNQELVISNRKLMYKHARLVKIPKSIKSRLKIDYK